ncbi:hypothetical protein QO010_002912 [Caulobacter ginsengisoli]|uniref:Uncharacterized protein n=1 Tax=Caulobacter ginsengisoli TaxID=400775 RepID=A0ABU0IT00_9CAUL|nr:hypothetical protein [Caulobacter ginsengisoli]MDQ0465128.1 hypothetical protein [Caulobacter ginsengisoli]
MRLAGVLGVLAGILLTSGCNLVIPEKAVFTRADAVGAPRLKPGYWTGPRCTADDVAAKVEGCPAGIIVGRSDLKFVVDTEKTPAAEIIMGEATYLLVPGKPLLLQWKLGGEPRPLVLYLAVRPLTRDSQGRITEAEIWPAMCGPPSANPRKPDVRWNEEGVLVHSYPTPTDQPFPGLTPKPESSEKIGCEPDGKAAIRNAAAASRSISDQVVVLHWDRDAAP